MNKKIEKDLLEIASYLAGGGGYISKKVIFKILGWSYVGYHAISYDDPKPAAKKFAREIIGEGGKKFGEWRNSRDPKLFCKTISILIKIVDSILKRIESKKE